ncbi:hypothetical protein Bbelb_126110 [Branchiostoma belcheri]|nr:hypothetical protein Bbelb_126110 [Branchiostoma belcheri]
MATTTKIDIPQSAEDISPYWVQQVLQKDLPGVSITDVHVKGSISQGKGIMSDIIAFDAVGIRNGASQRYSLVAKLTDFERPLKVLKQSIKDWQIKLDAHEIKFYSEAVPELLSVANTERKSEPWNEDGETQPLANPLWFIPKCYFAATDPSSMVSVRVMDNLKSQGFSIKANRQSLSRDEMMLAAGALAQLHDLSHRLELRSGVRLPEKYDCIMTVSGLSAMMTVSADHYQAAVKELAATFPDQADLVARLEKLDLQPHFSEKADEVLLLWSLVRTQYAEDAPTDVRLVDWQTPRYQPPTYELAMLFVCNASWDVFHNHRDAILAHYHHKLQNTLGTNELHAGTAEGRLQSDCLRGVITRFIRLMILPADPDLLRILQEIHEWGVI